MKTSNVRFVIAAVSLAVILAPGPASARRKRRPPPPPVDQRLIDSLLDTDGYPAYAQLPSYPSASRAAHLSLGATIIPIAAGALILRLQHPNWNEVRGHDGSITYYHETDPDRTLPLVLIAAGVFVGPSVGYFYGGLPGRGFGGIALRSTLGLASLALASQVARSTSTGGFADYSGLEAGLAIATIGGVMIVLHSIYDLATVSRAVTKNNCRKASRSLALEPTFSPTDGRPGIQLSLRF